MKLHRPVHEPIGKNTMKKSCDFKKVFSPWLVGLSYAVFLSLSCKTMAPSKSGITATTSDSGGQQKLAQLKQEVSDLADMTAQFWINNGIDQEYGGFYGTVKVDGTPDKESPKQLSQQARHLWFLSAYARLKNNPKAKKEAQSLFKFIYEKFRIKDGEYALYTDFRGDKLPPRDGKLSLYMHSFVIFSFSEYFKLTKDPVAQKEALAVLKNFPHDETHGGYDQSKEARWYAGVKETNSHMHAMESVMNLYETMPDTHGEKKFVYGRFKELFDIFMTKVTRNGFAYHDAFDAAWNPTGEGWVNYGHDFEIIHLLLKARKLLNPTDPATLAHIKKLAERAIKTGYDYKSGGSFYKGTLDGTVKDSTKIWWPQCEQLLALYQLHKTFPEMGTLELMEKTFRWIQNNHLSPSIPGAWFATAGNRGTQEWKDHLGTEWFASYHTMRALLEISFL